MLLESDRPTSIVHEVSKGDQSPDVLISDTVWSLKSPENREIRLFERQLTQVVDMMSSIERGKVGGGGLVLTA